MHASMRLDTCTGTSMSFHLRYGGLSTFFSGLEGLVGPLQPNVMQGMEQEQESALPMIFDLHLRSVFFY